MQKLLFFFIAIIFVLATGCINSENNKEKANSTNSSSVDSTVHERKDSMGRVIERWGNYNTDDRNTNFREFFYYDKGNNLVKEMRYFFEDDNPDCIIKDTSEYTELQYFYKKDNKSVLEKIICYEPEYDENNKFIKRELYYIKDVIRDTFLYRDDS